MAGVDARGRVHVRAGVDENVDGFWKIVLAGGAQYGLAGPVRGIGRGALRQQPAEQLHVASADGVEKRGLTIAPADGPDIRPQPGQ